MTAPAFVTPELMVHAKRPSIPVPRGARLVSFEAMVKRVSETQGATAAAAWTRTVLKHQAQINEAALRTAIASGNLSRIAKVVDAGKLQKALSAAVQPPLRTAAQTAGQQSVATLNANGITGTFDAVNPVVVGYARKQAAELVKGVPKDTKRVIGEVIAMGAEGALTVAEQARAIREVVGLPPNWAKAPLTFADELRRGAEAAATSRRLSAIDKQLIRNRIRAGTVDKAFIASMQERYTASLITRRSQNIARTEALRASHFGLQQSWIQMEKAGAMPKTARRFWIITPDSHLSPEHARIPSMNANGRKMNEPFVTTEGMHMFPPSRPNCRCSVGLVFFPPKKGAVAPAAVPFRPAAKVKARTQAPEALRRATVAPPRATPAGKGKVAPEVHQAVSKVLRDMGVDPKVVRYSTKLDTSDVAGPEGTTLAVYRDGKIYLDPRRPLEEIRQTVAHEASHFKFERALRNDRALADDLVKDYWPLSKEDGVTAYSRAHWQEPVVRVWARKIQEEWDTFSPRSRGLMLLPIDETLAEMQALKVAGRTVGTQRYRALLARVEKAAAGKKQSARRAAHDLLRPKKKRKLVEIEGDAAWTHAKSTAPAEWSPGKTTALKKYSGGSSGDINAALRSSNGQAITDLTVTQQKTVAQVDAAFGEVTPLSEPLVVYRGGLLPDEALKVGAEFQDMGFVSTSASKGEAEGFIPTYQDFVESGNIPWGAPIPTGRLIKIHAPEGARVIGMDARASIASHEQEILLPRGSRFRVRSVSTENAGTWKEQSVVELDYLPPEAPRVPTPKKLRVKKARTLRKAVSDDVFDGYVEGKKAEAAANRAKLVATIDERSALKAYQLVPDVNNALRTEQVQSLRSTDRKLVASLDSALQKNRVSQDLVVWRGTSPEWLPPEGVVFADKGFVSTTARPSVAAEFVGGTSRDIGALMRIGVPKGQPAVYMPQLGRSSYSPGEQELLLPRGTRFRVVRRREVSGAEANRLLGASSFYDEQRLIINDVEIVK